MISATDILNAKVLIVDDQESGARLLKEMLERPVTPTLRIRRTHMRFASCIALTTTR